MNGDLLQALTIVVVVAAGSVVFVAWFASRGKAHF